MFISSKSTFGLLLQFLLVISSINGQFLYQVEDTMDSGTVKVVAYKAYNYSNPYTNDTTLYKVFINSPLLDQSTWDFQLELEWIAVDGAGQGYGEPITLYGSVINNKVTMQWVPKVPPKEPESNFLWDLFPWLRPAPAEDTFGQILDTEIDTANHQAQIVLSLARNETQGFVQLMKMSLMFWKDRNGEVYLVDPLNPEQALNSTDQVQSTVMPYNEDKRNLYGYDKDFANALFYLNYALGFTGLFAGPLRSLITPVILFYWFIPPWGLLAEDNVYFTWDSFWFDVMRGWWASSFNQIWVYWVFDFIAFGAWFICLFYINDVLTFTSFGQQVLGLVGSSYLFQIFIDTCLFILGIFDMENLYPAADTSFYN